MKQNHWMLRLVQIAAVLFVLFAAFMIFIYSPFYSTLVVKTLNTLVPVEVNQVAAKSQQMAAFSDQDSLEPGSDLWIARQAYLKLMEQEIQSENSQNLTLIQARYKALQALIIEEQTQKKLASEQELRQVPLLVSNVASEAVVEDPSENVKALLNLDSHENQALMEQYLAFLSTHKIAETENEPVDEEIFKDIASIQQQNMPKTLANSKPYAIVVLGGGLTLDDNGKDIVVNDYTRLRLETTLAVVKQYQLPIVLSGVEAPDMQN